MKQLLVNLILLIVALVLSIPLIPLGVLYTIIRSLARRDGDKVITYTSKSLYIIAYGFDCIGNVVCRDLFNRLLIQGENKYHFGRWTETISSVLGKNQISKTLTRAGRCLVSILDYIDPNHCIKSIQILPKKPLR